MLFIAVFQNALNNTRSIALEYDVVDLAFNDLDQLSDEFFSLFVFDLLLSNLFP
jgi:hypothetical protein